MTMATDGDKDGGNGDSGFDHEDKNGGIDSGGSVDGGCGGSSSSSGSGDGSDNEQRQQQRQQQAAAAATQKRWQR